MTKRTDLELSSTSAQRAGAGSHRGPVIERPTALDQPRVVRSRRSKGRPVFVGIAFLAAIGFFLVNIVDPYSGATASPDFAVQHSDRFNGQPIQELAVATGAATTISRDSYSVVDPPPPPPPPPPAPVAPSNNASTDSSDSSGSSSAPAAGTPDPGSAQAYAQGVLTSRGLGSDEFSCLVSLWNRESGWNVYASNSSSGAYGIPQSLPGSKMASAGPDWQNSYQTQVNWGLGYIFGRYSTPCGAWAHSESSGWY